MSWDAGEPERLEFKSVFGKAFDIVSVMFSSHKSVLLLLNMPDGGASTGLLGLLQLIRSQTGLRVIEIVEKTGKPKRTIERWLKQLKARGDIEFRGAAKMVGIT